MTTNLHSEHEPIYTISIVAKLLVIHPQTLRQYDRLGLITPSRSNGRNRLYSQADLQKIKEICNLSRQGIPLNFIEKVLIMQEEIETLHKEIRYHKEIKNKTALVLWKKL